MEKEETPEHALIREVKEEINIEIEIIEKFKTLRIKNAEIYNFLCRPKSFNIIMNDEILDAKWFKFDELNSLRLIPGFDKVLEKASAKLLNI
jgi:8-oxo-dGTP diphosphatase